MYDCEIFDFLSLPTGKASRAGAPWNLERAWPGGRKLSPPIRKLSPATQTALGLGGHPVSAGRSKICQSRTGAGRAVLSAWARLIKRGFRGGYWACKTSTEAL